jgi:hypothetical protein
MIVSGPSRRQCEMESRPLADFDAQRDLFTAQNRRDVDPGRLTRGQKAGHGRGHGEAQDDGAEDPRIARCHLE